MRIGRTYTTGKTIDLYKNIKQVGVYSSNPIVTPPSGLDTGNVPLL
jgi:hypothetical protein